MQYNFFEAKKADLNFPNSTNLPIQLSESLNLGLLYIDLIIVLNQCLSEYHNQLQGLTLREKLLNLLVRTKHLQGIDNVIKNAVVNASGIIISALKSAASYDAVDVINTLITLHKEQITNEMLEQSLKVATTNNSQRIITVIEQELQNRESEEYNNPAFWYSK